MLDNMYKFACIIIWYKPSDNIIEKWRIMIESYRDMGRFIIIDNTPDNIVHSEINWNNTDYICLNENKGIAEAQNIGINKAQQLGIDFLFFFDQDTIVSSLYFTDMIDAYNRIKKEINTSMILGPKHISINQDIDYVNKPLQSCHDYLVVDSVLSSGTLINSEVINIVGLMNSKLFIDQVDHEYCYRASSKKIPTIINNRITLSHQIGNKVVNVFGINFIISAPFRYYYQFRNSLLLLRYNHTPKRIKRKIILRKLIDFFVLPIINYPNTFLVLMNIIKGIKDGIFFKS